MKIKMKNKSQRYDINRPRSIHGHKYKQCKKRLIMMTPIGIKQQRSKIWSLIHKKIKQHWGWVEKKALLVKKGA